MNMGCWRHSARREAFYSASQFVSPSPRIPYPDNKSCRSQKEKGNLYRIPDGAVGEARPVTGTL